MRQELIHKIIDGLAVIIIASATFFLWTNRDYFSVPDPDIFQYIGEAQQYIQLKLPENIQLPPAYPVLIGFASVILRAFPHPEILAAHGLNILASVFTLGLMYCFLRRHSSLFGLITVLLLATNPLFIFSSLNTNSEVLFTTATVLVFLLYQNGYKKITYISAGLSFLIRYEGLLVLIAIILVDIIKRENLQKVCRLSLVALIPVFFWATVAHTHNASGTILGNGYIQEVIRQKQRIPQLGLLLRAPFVLAHHIDTKLNGFNRSMFSLFIYSLFFIGAYSILQTKNETLILPCVFTFLYLFFHIFFPYAPDRYLYPLVWIFIMVLTRGISIFSIRVLHVAFAGVIIYIVLTNLFKTNEYRNLDHANNSMFSRYYRHEVRTAGEWLTNTTFDKPVIIFTYEPWIMEYYTANDQVFFRYISSSVHQRCDTVECLIASQNINLQDYNILYIQQSNSLSTDASFPSATDLNVKIFNETLDPLKNISFTLLAHLSESDTWAKIYQYQLKK